MTLPPAPANGAENRHMSDGDGVCGGSWNICNLTVIYNLTMCGEDGIYNIKTQFYISQ